MMKAISRRTVLRCVSLAALLPALGGTRALAAALQSAVDAQHFGLHPGAPIDQAKGLSKALRSAASAGRPLFIPPGRYEVSEVALPQNGAHIIGVPGQSRLVLREGSALLKAVGAAQVRLEGLILDGAGVPLRGPEAGLLDVEDADDVVLDDCEFLQSGGAGARIRASAGRIENCRFESIATVGILLDQSRGMRASGNVVADCGNTGILVSRDAEGEDATLVTQNRVSHIRADSGGTGQNGNGINLDKANGVIVADNRIDDCAFSAIRCYSSDAVNVTGNIATKSGEMALYVEFAWQGAIVGNNQIDGGNGGISMTNYAEQGGRLGVCSGNIVRNITGGPTYPDGNLQVGAGIAAEADVAISGNVVEDAVWGLQLGWGPYLRDVTATGNIIRRTKIGIAVSIVEGAGPTIVADNLISSAEQGAILGTRWADIATGELIGGSAIPPGLTLTGNRNV